MPSFPKELMICVQQIIIKIRKSFKKCHRNCFLAISTEGAVDREKCFILAVTHCLAKQLASRHKGVESRHSGLDWNLTKSP